jgi:hypothetical protein
MERELEEIFLDSVKLLIIWRLPRSVKHFALGERGNIAAVSQAAPRQASFTKR